MGVCPYESYITGITVVSSLEISVPPNMEDSSESTEEYYVVGTRVGTSMQWNMHSAKA